MRGSGKKTTPDPAWLEKAVHIEVGLVVGPAADREDVEQEVRLALLEHGDAIEKAQYPHAYARQVMRSAIADWGRGKKRQARVR